jgi:hypothetical protein
MPHMLRLVAPQGDAHMRCILKYHFLADLCMLLSRKSMAEMLYYNKEV